MFRIVESDRYVKHVPYIDDPTNWAIVNEDTAQSPEEAVAKLVEMAQGVKAYDARFLDENGDPVLIEITFRLTLEGVDQ